MDGYESARALCLGRGPEVALRSLRKGSDAAFEAGFDWGIWDYEDANGLPHARESHA